MRQITPEADIMAHLDNELKKKQDAIINLLMYVGENCIREARLNHGYKDQTGNLSSSMGYLILNNGITVKSGGLDTVKQGSEGSVEGGKFLAELASSNRTGIVLIVVAGMNYAAYVETNYNVLASSELIAQTMVPRLMKQLGFKVQ